jgi:hypothetical protein
MFVKEFGKFINISFRHTIVFEVFLSMTVVFDEGLVFIVVDFKHYSSIGKLGELNGFLQEANSSLFESDSANSVINNSFDLNFFSAHCDKS